MADIAYKTASGTADAITVSKQGFTLTDGQYVEFKATTNNTGNMTIKVNGEDVKSLRNEDAEQLSSGDIEANKYYKAIYNSGSDFFQLAPRGGTKINNAVTENVVVTNGPILKGDLCLVNDIGANKKKTNEISLMDTTITHSGSASSTSYNYYPVILKTALNTFLHSYNSAISGGTPIKIRKMTLNADNTYTYGSEVTVSNGLRSPTNGSINILYNENTVVSIDSQCSVVITKLDSNSNPTGVQYYSKAPTSGGGSSNQYGKVVWLRDNKFLWIGYNNYYGYQIAFIITIPVGEDSVAEFSPTIQPSTLGYNINILRLSSEKVLCLSDDSWAVYQVTPSDIFSTVNTGSNSYTHTGKLIETSNDGNLVQFIVMSSRPPTYVAQVDLTTNTYSVVEGSQQYFGFYPTSFIKIGLTKLFGITGPSYWSSHSKDVCLLDITNPLAIVKVQVLKGRSMFEGNAYNPIAIDDETIVTCGDSSYNFGATGFFENYLNLYSIKSRGNALALSDGNYGETIKILKF